MKSKEMRRKILIIGGVGVVIVGIIIFLIMFLGRSDSEYSFVEKSWINDNVNNVIDISMPSDMPVFSSSGKGVFIDFVKDLESDTNLSFNIINTNANYTFKTTNTLGKNDLVLYTDHYVLVSPEYKSIVSLDSLKDKKVAVLSDDMSRVTNYLSDITGISYTSYASYDEISKAFDEGVKYAVLPLYKYMDLVVYNEINVIYHLDGLNYFYVLSMSSDGSKFNDVLTKFLYRWNGELNTSINENLLDLYYTANELTEVQKESIVSEDFIVGYIDNLPIEGKINRKFSGITNEYLKEFSEFTGATYKYIEYKNVNNLVNAMGNKRFDVVYNYYSISNGNYDATSTLNNIDYVVLANHSNNFVIKDINSLNGRIVKAVNGTNLTKYLESNGISVDKYDDYEKLIKSLEVNDVLIVEKETYDYYKSDKLEDYSIRLLDTASVSSNFLLNVDNTIFNDLFKFFINVVSSERVKIDAVNSSLEELNSNIFLGFVISNITYILVLIFAMTLFFYIFNRKVKITKKIKREDKLMYLDVMTNLKNRNFLNDNIEYWETNKVYPQAIVVVDLKKIKEINDTFGHEEGDNQIKAAANILIKTQRENSEIIRTDGNEFLVYMVGYEEKVITTYMHKLNKEFAHLPKPYGVSMGYSMIEDELKSIDDAVNEALIMMRKNKGE